MSNEFKLVPVEPILLIVDRIKFNCPKAAIELEQILAAAPQPPALGGEPDVFAWAWSEVYVGGKFDAEEAHYGVSFGAEKPNIRPSIAGTVVKYLPLVDRAHLAPLQAEIERLKAEDEIRQMVEESLRVENDQLQARCDELEHRATDVVEGADGEQLPGAMTMRIRKLKAALSKPAGSEPRYPISEAGMKLIDESIDKDGMPS